VSGRRVAAREAIGGAVKRVGGAGSKRERDWLGAARRRKHGSRKGKGREGERTGDL
jgi:hypothetical protein